MKYAIEERLEWRHWVTPKPLESKPIHRWYVFPHSFTSELVDALIDEWNLVKDDFILDPFAGAGTTIFAAKAKSEYYNLDRIETTWKKLQKTIDVVKWNGYFGKYPELVIKALPGKTLSAFDTTAKLIEDINSSPEKRDFFRLALVSIIPEFSTAVATGGWLKWVKAQKRVSEFQKVLSEKVQMMIGDLEKVKLTRTHFWNVQEADARALPDKENTYTAVITSPPYPNRHDYTRVFGVELMFGFLDWEGTRKLRYQSFHSHPEARPKRGSGNDYVKPVSLSKALKTIIGKGRDIRVPKMLEGYFLDMFLCLKECKRICQSGSRLVFVLGNAQYYGQPFLVDELTAEIGEQAGLRCEKIIVARYRGNSAQQRGMQAFARKFGCFSKFINCSSSGLR